MLQEKLKASICLVGAFTLTQYQSPVILWEASDGLGCGHTTVEWRQPQLTGNLTLTKE